MDSRQLEPGAWVHEDQPRFQALLRRGIRGEIRGVPGYSYETRIRFRIGP